MAFERFVDIRWRDTDALGHVNHVVFLTYLEDARDALYEQVIGSPIYVVARLEIDYLGEVLRDHRKVAVGIEVERVGKTSLTTCETIRVSPERLAARARVVTVRYDADSHQPVPFTEAERARLAVLAP